MQYNTEVINEMAQPLGTMFIDGITPLQENGNTLTMADIEHGMGEALRQVGLHAIGVCLAGLEATPAKTIPCDCGGVLQYQRKREATVICVFGRLRYQRSYYGGCACEKGKAPLDARYGLEPGAVTAGLAQLLALGGIEFSYDESPDWLEKFLLYEVAENTVRCETERMGQLQDQQEKGWIQASQHEDQLQERQRLLEAVPARLYGSIDAAKVRIEPRPKRGEDKPEHEDWRDMKILCWYEVEEVTPAQQSARQRAKVARDQAALRAKNMRYFCDIQEAEAFGQLVWATGKALQADLSPVLIFLGDGAPWIWKLVSTYFPHALQIVDGYHAEEHLEKCAKEVFPEGARREAWLEGLKQALWEGQVEAVISACEAFAKVSEQARKDATYFYTNAERMRYDRFRAAGYLIGSGTIESGCKQIVTHRLKLPGAQWTVEGAVNTAKARAVWLSGQWQSLCDQRAALPLAV